MGSVDEVDGGSCGSGDDVEIAVQWEASMKLTSGAAAAVVEQKSLMTLCMVQVKEPCCWPSRCRCWRSGR